MGTCSVRVVRDVGQLPRLGEMPSLESIFLSLGHQCSQLNQHGAAAGIGWDEQLARSGRR